MKLVCTLILTFALTSVSHAKPITFIFEAHVSGESLTYGGSYSSIVITATGDTSDRVVQDNSQRLFSYIVPKTASFELTGLGTGYFDKRIWPNEIQVYGTGTTKPGHFVTMFYADGSHLVTFASLANWDWESSVGPIITTGGVNYSWLSWADSHVYGYFPVTFTAIVTPEPTTIMLAAGSLLLPSFRRQR